MSINSKRGAHAIATNRFPVRGVVLPLNLVRAGGNPPGGTALARMIPTSYEIPFKAFIEYMEFKKASYSTRYRASSCEMA